MKPNQPISFDSKLKGMSVLNSTTGARIGEVVDLILEPIEGRVLGIAVHTSDKEKRSLEVERIHVGDDAVMTTDPNPAALSFSGSFEGGVLSSEIIGAKLVTEDGKLVGAIKELYLSRENMQLIYRVAESNLQQVFGGGFYISAEVPRAYAPEENRMIVPSDIEEHHARKDLKEFASPAQSGEERPRKAS